MILKLLENRRTTRNFLQDNVQSDDLQSILKSIIANPSKNCIYPYRAVVLTQSNVGKQMKQHLYRHGTITKWEMSRENPITNYFINDVTTKNIRYVQLLRQVLAPVVVCFIGSFYNDVNKNNSSNTLDNQDYFVNRNRLANDGLGLIELMDSRNYEPIIRVTRDVSIAAASCLLTAEELGYDTAYVGNGTQHDNILVNKVPYLNLTDTETLLLMVCIGKKAPVADKRCVEVERQIINADTTEIVFWESQRHEHIKNWPNGGPFITDLVEII